MPTIILVAGTRNILSFAYVFVIGKKCWAIIWLLGFFNDSGERVKWLERNNQNLTSTKFSFVVNISKYTSLFAYFNHCP